MPQALTKPTDFWSGFSVALSAKAEKRPTGQGWKSLDELTTLWGLFPTTAIKRAKAGVRAGLLERFEGQVVRDGRLVRAVWYRRKGA
jgi:hypothetical protein